MKKFLCLGMIVVFLVYIDKTVCKKSDINQEAIGGHYQLGGDGGATMESP